MRICGECTECCTLVGVQELDKPRGVSCIHELPGRGCAIYRERPGSCRKFACGWLSSKKWPAYLRPDRCGFVMAVFEKHPDLLVLFVRPEKKFCWLKPTNKSVINSALGLSMKVLVKCGDMQIMYAPPKLREELSVEINKLKSVTMGG